MTGYHDQPASPRLRVLAKAAANSAAIKRLLRHTTDFGGLHAQIARAAVSVVSLIAEGDGMRTDKAKREYFARARGSNQELGAQLRLLLDEQPAHPVHDEVDHLGRMLTKLVRALE